MNRPWHRGSRSWHPSAAALLTVCVGIGAAVAAEDTASPTTTPFELAPILVGGRTPAPNVVLTLTQLPTDAKSRRKLLADLRASIARLPDASVQLRWRVPTTCHTATLQRLECTRPSARPALDASARDAFDAFLTGVESSAITSFGFTAASDATLALATIGQIGDIAPLPPEADAARACRQTHVVMQGTDIDAPATRRSPERVHQGEDAQPAVVHQSEIVGGATNPRVDETLQTALAESQGPDGMRTSALLLVPEGAGTQKRVVAARYNARGWQGELAARALKGNAVDTGSAPWGRQANGDPHTTATLLDEKSPDARVILTSQGDGDSLQGTPWRWSELPQQQRAQLDLDARQRADGLGAQRVAWLRGARDHEQSRGGALRDRLSLQADMVGATPWLALGRPRPASAPPEPTMIYAAGNGGMLHAFDAESGAERFAYVPQGVLGPAAALTHPSYTHLPSVAASPFTVDWREGAQSRRWLIGMLGAGGTGYFALDVSDLAAFADEAQGARQVRLDHTASNDPDVGHIFGEPVTEPGDGTRSASVMRLNDGRTALVIGNGFESPSKSPVLLIQYLDGARELRKLVAESSSDNGLGPARLVDLDGDQKADFAYAGDARGRLWKFDLRGADPAQWRTALGGRPLFSARDTQGRPQPISTAPVWWPHPKGGRMLVFGTGQLRTRNDRQDTTAQSIYGLHDADDGPISGGRSALRRREAALASAPLAPTSLRPSLPDANAAPPAAPGLTSASGWYIDLPLPGERVLEHPRHFDGQLIDIVSTLPAPVPAHDAPETCAPAQERQFRSTVRALDGDPPRSAIYGTPDAPSFGSRVELSLIPGVSVRGLSRETRINFDGGQDEAARSRLGFTAVRPGWRQLQ